MKGLSQETKPISDNKFAAAFSEKKIDAIFTELDQCHLPGAAVGIAIGGRPVYRKGFGVASMELPVVLSPSIRARIGSITKQFAAFAYMLLCDDGKAGIDDSIEKYLPELHPITHKVTMRQLMGNISGLRDVHGISWQFSGVESPASSADLLSLYRDIDDVNFAPGTAYSYNNGGWLILSVAIERITGQTLEQVMRERIFEPIGMYDTLLRRSDNSFVPNCATTHMMDLAGGFEKFCVGTAVAGEGGMLSTVDDMLRWLAHMDAPRVGSPATWAVMKAPQVLVNGTSTGYGLGLATGCYRGVERLFHPGGWWGGNAQVLKVPGAGLNVVIMVNRHDIDSTLLANKILDVCLPELVPVKEAFRGPFATGTFRSRTTDRVIRLFGRERQQIASIDGGPDIMVEPDDDGVLWPAGPLGFLKQAITLIGDPAQPASIRFNDFSNLDELIAVQAVDKPAFGSIVGRYRSDTTGTEVTIFEAGDSPQLRTAGRFGSVVYGLECLADGIWLAKSTASAAQFWSGILSFDGDGGALRFSGWSNWALPFRRVR